MAKRKKRTNEDIIQEIEKTGDEFEDIREDLEKAGDEVEDIKEDLQETGKEVKNIKKDLGTLKKTLKEIKSHTKSSIKKVGERIIPDEYAFDDMAQQIVGALILSTPFAVTEEVWKLSQALDESRVFLIILITILFDILMIYYTKYQKVKTQNIVSFIPLRLFSLVIISYTMSTITLNILGVIGTQVTDPIWIFKLIILVGLFANIGAATADIIR